MISPQERAQAASGACPHRVIDEIYFGLRLRRLSRFHFSAHDAVFCAIHDVHLGFAICVDCGGCAVSGKLGHPERICSHWDP